MIYDEAVDGEFLAVSKAGVPTILVGMVLFGLLTAILAALLRRTHAA